MQYNSIKTRTTSNELRWIGMNYNKIRQKYTKTKIQIDGKKVNKKTKNKDINFLPVFFTLFSKLLVFMFSSPVFSDGCVLYCVSVHHLFLCFSQLSCFFLFSIFLCLCFVSVLYFPADWVCSTPVFVFFVIIMFYFFSFLMWAIMKISLYSQWTKQNR